MAKGWVFDSSAILALLLSEEHGARVHDILEEVIAKGGSIHVPALFPFEVSNALLMASRRGRLQTEEVSRLEIILWELPLSVEPPPDHVVMVRIRELAERHSLTAYDSAYLEMADRMGARLKTLDRHLLDLKDRFSFIE